MIATVIDDSMDSEEVAIPHSGLLLYHLLSENLKARNNVSASEDVVLACVRLCGVDSVDNEMDSLWKKTHQHYGRCHCRDTKTEGHCFPSPR
jgi:hypothetical protein